MVIVVSGGEEEVNVWLEEEQYVLDNAITMKDYGDENDAVIAYRRR